MTVRPTELEAVIFDIQRFSLQDGPGIRTSVFFKGCPLRCAWCHNPESHLRDTQLQYNDKLCVGCGACQKACKRGVHSFRESGGAAAHLVAYDKCNGCGDCIKVCCYDALKLLGSRYTVAGLMRKLEGDRPYFAKRDAQGSTGGVTLTGGEPMMQFSFVKAFLQNKGDLHVCMETCGYAPTDHFRQILPLTDLFLFDYKASDPALHKALCGQDNKLIMENLEYLYAHHARIILRLPLIPGVNDDEAHLSAAAGFLKTHPDILQAEVMAYHRLGVGKTRQLGMKAMPVDLPNTATAQKEAWIQKLRNLGAGNVILG